MDLRKVISMYVSTRAASNEIIIYIYLGRYLDIFDGAVVVNDCLNGFDGRQLLSFSSLGTYQLLGIGNHWLN